MKAETAPRRSEPRLARALSGPASIFVALLPVIACLLGGATAKWSEGMVVALLGAFLLFSPPRRSLGWALNLVFLALLLCAALSFLPADWFSMPSWRKSLADDFKILLPASVTPQPWFSLECFLSLLAGMAWLYFVCTQELELRGVRLQLRLFATGVVFLAALSLLLYWLHTAPSFWQNERGFGPFPNRNQTADLFGIVSILILAAGQDDIRYNRKRWILWLIALVLVVCALILNFSRAGILLLVLGSALWIGAVAMRAPSSARLALGSSFILLLASGLLIFGGATLERFHLPGLVWSDFRWLVFRDAWSLIRSSPWCGIGLGNFETVFAIFRDASHGNSRALHPESDWLWLWAEAGPAAPVLILVGVILLLRHVAPLTVGSNQRFRLAALVGALLFALHGCIDVSGHRVGTAYASLFLFGLALHRPSTFPASRWVPWLFRGLGLLLLTTGVAWIAAARGSPLLPGPLGAESARHQAEMASRGRDYKQAIALTTKALEWAPLDWQLYYLRAASRIAGRESEQDALDDFRRARFLEPNSPTVPLEEGIIWSATNPGRSFVAWGEALRRAGKEQRAEVFSRIFFNGAVANPNGRSQVERLAYNYDDLTIAYWQQLPGLDFQRALRRYLQLNPDLSSLDDNQKREVFRLWQERGDQIELDAFVKSHPEVVPLAWRFMAQENAQSGDFKKACEIMVQNNRPPAFPSSREPGSLEQLRARTFRGTSDYAAGYSLAKAQEQAGLIDDELVTVRHFTDTRSAPSYFNFMEAQAWAAKQSWERSWKAWLAFEQVRATNR